MRVGKRMAATFTRTPCEERDGRPGRSAPLLFGEWQIATLLSIDVMPYHLHLLLHADTSRRVPVSGYGRMPSTTRQRGNCDYEQYSRGDLDYTMRTPS